MLLTLFIWASAHAGYIAPARIRGSRSPGRHNYQHTKKLVDWLKENRAEDFYVDCGQIDSFSMSSKTGGSLMAIPTNRRDGCVIMRYKK